MVVRVDHEKLVGHALQTFEPAQPRPTGTISTFRPVSTQVAADREGCAPGPGTRADGGARARRRAGGTGRVSSACAGHCGRRPGRGCRAAGAAGRRRHWCLAHEHPRRSSLGKGEKARNPCGEKLNLPRRPSTFHAFGKFEEARAACAILPCARPQMRPARRRSAPARGRGCWRARSRQRRTPRAPPRARASAARCNRVRTACP